MKIIEDKITKRELIEMAKNQFGSFVKAVVDIEKGVMALGADLHADEEAFLLERGSKQENLWGINLYPEQSPENWIEFDSMINIRPSQGNNSRTVENPDIREGVITTVNKLVI